MPSRFSTKRLVETREVLPKVSEYRLGEQTAAKMSAIARSGDMFVMGRCHRRTMTQWEYRSVEPVLQNIRRGRYSEVFLDAYQNTESERHVSEISQNVTVLWCVGVLVSWSSISQN